MKSKRRRGGAPILKSEEWEEEIVPISERLNPMRSEPERPQLKQSIYITLHANSCNKLVSENDLLGKFKDPSLSHYGVYSMFRHNPAHIEDESSNVNFTYKVYVSCCVRTWMTAILLYGRKCKNLRLVVAPFLKEYGSDPGNMPESIPVQCKKMDRFREFLLQIEKRNDPSISVQLDSMNACKILDCKIKVFLPYNSEPIYNWNKSTELKHSCNSHELEFSTYPNAQDVPLLDLVTSLEKKTPNTPLSISAVKDKLTYTTEMTTYYDDGIYRFCSWIPNQIIPGYFPTIYAVSHSHLMKKTLKSFNVQLSESVTTSNAWTIGIQKSIWSDSFIDPRTNLKRQSFDIKKQSIQLIQYSNGVTASTKRDPVEELCSGDESAGQEIYKTVTGIRPASNTTRSYLRNKLGMNRFANSFTNARNWFTRKFTQKRPVNERNSLIEETKFQQNGEDLNLKARGDNRLTKPNAEVIVEFNKNGGRSKRGKKRRTQRKR
jgi:hypothetical protein